MMQKFIVGNIFFSAAIGVFSLLYPSALYAQSSTQPPSTGQSTPQSQPPQKDVSDKELQSFAKAYVEVEEIRASQQASLSQVEKPEQAQKIQQETSAKTVKAVEKQGLTPETYNQILTAVNSDGALAKKALDLIEKEKSN
jgi:Domain of unknown function (DUF4168)